MESNGTSFRVKAFVFILVLCVIPCLTLIRAEEDHGEVDNKKSFLAQVNGEIEKVLFFDMAFGAIRIDHVNRDGSQVLDELGNPEKEVVRIPFLVMLLIVGGIFFTFWFRWITIRGFKHSIDVIRGKFDRPEDTGEISHFRALTSALSATVGLGNIAGVAVAIQLGGPGAVFG